MKSPLPGAQTCASFFVLTMSILPMSIFAQGSLTPPGAPQATMKRLDQIEPRIDLQNAPAAAVDTGNAGYHFLINQPGSYYLSGPINVTKPNGIQITVEGVTLDFNGFTMARTSGAGGQGLEVVTSAHHTSIRNGAISGFDRGIRLTNGVPRACVVRDFAVSGCAINGIEGAVGTVFENCRAHDNSGEGMSAPFGRGCVFVNCTATNNQGTSGINAGDGATVINCTASNNTGTNGIATGYNSVVTNCVADYNTCAYGIYGGYGSTLTNCAAYANTSAAAVSAGIGLDPEASASNCSSIANLSTGGATASNGMGFNISDSCRIEHCTADQNKGDGIRTGQSCTIRENHCAFNGNGGDGAGIHVVTSGCRVDSNSVLRNDRGIDVDGTSNLIIRNTAVANLTNGNVINFDIVANNHYGTIQATGGGAAAVTGAGTVAGTIGTTDPWANISQ